MLKRTLFRVITAACLFALLTAAVYAADTVRVQADRVIGIPGETVDVALRITDNPGINNGGFSISYDSNVLTFQSWTTDGTVFTRDEIDGNFSGNPIIVSAFTGKNDKTADGEFLTLHFAVRSDAPAGEYPVTLTSGRLGGFTNIREEDVTPVYENGSVRIPGQQSEKQEEMRPEPSEPTRTTESKTAFADVKPSDWFCGVVDYVCEKGLMNGTSAAAFSPAQTVTRGMLVTILWRMDGSRTVNYAMRFKDVPSNEWYTEAVRWATSERIVEGYSAERFAPNDAVTREQMAAILYRFAEKQGRDTSAGGTLSFADADAVSAWAKTAMQWACQSGLLQGSNGKLLPKDGVTRAQTAAILQRFCEG